MDPTTDDEIKSLITGFQGASLTDEQWTHRAHLIVGLWHVDRYGHPDALARLRAGILRLNTAIGVANTDTSGYHETLTRFYVWALAAHLAGRADGESFLVRVNDLLRGPMADRAYPLRYYSRERVMSVQARHSWLTPDLTHIDEWA